MDALVCKIFIFGCLIESWRLQTIYSLIFKLVLTLSRLDFWIYGGHQVIKKKTHLHLQT